MDKPAFPFFSIAYRGHHPPVPQCSGRQKLGEDVQREPRVTGAFHENAGEAEDVVFVGGHSRQCRRGDAAGTEE